MDNEGRTEGGTQRVNGLGVVGEGMKREKSKQLRHTYNPYSCRNKHITARVHTYVHITLYIANGVRHG